MSFIFLLWSRVFSFVPCPFIFFLFTTLGLSELKPSLLFWLKVDYSNNVFFPMFRVLNFYPQCIGAKTHYYVSNVLLTPLRKNLVRVTCSLGILSIYSDRPHSIISKNLGTCHSVMGQKSSYVRELSWPFEPKYLLFVCPNIVHLSQNSFCFLSFRTLN